MSKKGLVLNNKLYNDSMTPEITKIRESVKDIYEKLERKESLTDAEKERLNNALAKEQEELKKPVYVEQLKPLPSELMFCNLSDGEKFQILVRYLNDLAVFNKNTMALLSTLVNYVAVLSAKVHGVDVDKELETLREENEAKLN